MKLLFSSITVFICALFLSFFITPAFAATAYGTGTYTNLCGTGTAASSNTCNKGCNPTTGTCSSSNPYVVKWTCNGNLIECRSNESSWSTSHSLSGTKCGKTVQIDVFDHNCRDGGANTWSCPGDKNLVDYMVWYSGDCAPKKKNISSCDALTITSGNDSLVPASVSFQARGSDNAGSIQNYRFHFGDGQQIDTTNSQATHLYQSSGSFRAVVHVKDSKGVWKTSSSCETSVTVRALPVESHKSDCSDLFIQDGNNAQPPVTGKFAVNGFDNKGTIKRYKMDFGNGTVRESDTNSFQQHYDKSGTYTIRGFIQDTKGNWKGGSGNCQKSLYVNTPPLTSQPDTGTPTVLTLIGITSGMAGLGLLWYRNAQMTHAALAARKKRRTRNR